MAERRVALLAIAKNEGAYLGRFVAHHLALGFGPICVAVNRSDDGSAEILRKIAAADPRVRLVDGDAFLEDVEPAGFQRRAYRGMMDALSGELGPDDHACFLDVDEAWMPLDGAATIQEQLAGWRHPDRVVGSWFNLAPGDRAFRAPLDGPLRGRLNPNVKTIWRWGLAPEGFNPHVVLLDGAFTEHVPAGLPVVQERGRLETRPTAPGDAVVLHDMYRSEVEYLASLVRGRPSDKARPFKTNRVGYWMSDETAAERGVGTMTLAPGAGLDAIRAEAARLRAGFGIEAETRAAEAETVLRALTCLERYENRKDGLPEKLLVIFDRVDMARAAAEAERLLEVYDAARPTREDEDGSAVAGR